MRSPASFLALALLASCAPKPPVQVSVAVPVPCIAPDKVPTPPVPPQFFPLGDSDAALSIALGSLIEYKAYVVEADGALRGCAGVR